MSTCPKDLHSVYIDGEMPENFVKEYEAIVASDEKIRLEQEKFRKIHEIMERDSAEKTVDGLFMEQSFERLQSKMRYSKVVSDARKPSVLPFVKYVASFSAAAAVFAMIFTPIHMKALKASKIQELNPINIMTKAEAPDLAKKDVIVDGNISAEHLPSVFAGKKSEAKPVKAEVRVALESETSENSAGTSEVKSEKIEQKTVQATVLASNGAAPIAQNRYEHRFRERLPSVDVFQPDFSSSAIRISVPKIHEMSNNFEMNKKFFQDEGR